MVTSPSDSPLLPTLAGGRSHFSLLLGPSRTPDKTIHTCKKSQNSSSQSSARIYIINDKIETLSNASVLDTLISYEPLEMIYPTGGDFLLSCTFKDYTCR